ncbi:phosphoribosylformyl-glycineamide synthetase [Escherichia coli]|nr:phosphoribosylformyl-glycineamide synthetase [Escherichia marmotae]EEV6993432.1 phosphoribosylformyl-glycineamide synthetase [Escherichia coli]PSS40895.1 phosphoribosylformyl-glycineamide synthetase [Escherichia sp. MOD1-EC5451]PSY66881.1 phosphoribosylformyl-glycineamide synthetase [Escherichia sp. 20412-1]EFA4950599.1 phosphoribosylformyl-glycineamide synthetase [Escherichia coli]
MSGILRKPAPVGNLLQILAARVANPRRRFYFHANGFVSTPDSL